MRLCMGMKYIKGTIPQHYNHYVQAAFYNKLPTVIAESLHERGFQEGPRKFKLFTFSRLMGDFERENDGLKFDPKSNVYLCFSSPMEIIVKEMAKTIMEDPVFRIGKGEFYVDSMKVRGETVSEGQFYTLSPVTIYKHVEDGVRYISPYEAEFQHLASLNAERKLMAIIGRRPTTPLRVVPLQVNSVGVRYKKNYIIAWKGKFTITGPSSLIKVIYEAGLGSKNSQGFGMLEVEGKSVRD